MRKPIFNDAIREFFKGKVMGYSKTSCTNWKQLSVWKCIEGENVKLLRVMIEIGSAFLSYFVIWKKYHADLITKIVWRHPVLIRAIIDDLWNDRPMNLISIQLTLNKTWTSCFLSCRVLFALWLLCFKCWYVPEHLFILISI